MASSIEWTNKTWNPTTGCTKISKECDFCYAEKETYRKMFNPKLPKYKLGFDVVVEHEYTLQEPYKWKNPSTVFVNSMSDMFHKHISLEFIKKVFQVMNDTPQHTYQVLTKRGDILEKYSKHLTWTDNIWMGVSVGNQKATRRIKSLVGCGAKHKFLSIEPLIEEIKDIQLDGIDWVIVGGESGSNAVRPMEKDWVTTIQKACSDQNVKFFFKQWGKNRNNPNQKDPTINKEHRYHSKGGSELDGKVYWSNPTVNDDSIPMINLFGVDYLIMDDFQDLKTIWELKSHLPLASKELLESLSNDIEKNGVNDPILYTTLPKGEKLVLDGHTRLKIAISNKIKSVPTKEVLEHFHNLDEVKLWITKHQIERRNLSTVEKITLALLSKPSIEKLAKENLSKGGKASKNAHVNETTTDISKVDTYNEIAKLAKVGRTTVVQFSKILAEAPQSVIDDLNNGTKKISSVYASLIKSKAPPEPPTRPETKIQSNITKLLSIDEGQEKLKTKEIDVIMILDQHDNLDILKKNEKIRIGVYYLD